MSVRNLEPKALWNNFADLNAVPRPSKKEEKVIEFMLQFGKSLQLETIQDSIGNVIIKKPASKGMEDRKTIILQSHLDMVHQKNEETVFDFDTQGIEMLVDGDWVKANGTTLGADNGIGVASIMALLETNEIPHPAFEAMFTVDEETGMTGAKYLDPTNFEGKILLNLDTEDDDELSIGCAGGIDTNTNYSYQEEEIKSGFVSYQLFIKGLLGGHSGMDINKGRGNANKLLNRILYDINSFTEVQLISFNGGSLRNAIPREANSVFAVDGNLKVEVETRLNEFIDLLKTEFNTIEPNLSISFKSITSDSKAATKEEFSKIMNAIYSVPNGVFRMSPDFEGLVECSSSLAKISLKNGTFETQSLQRSSVDSTKTDIANAVKAAFENMGATVVQGGEYPGWKPDPEAAILKIMIDLYRKIYNEEPNVKACHAGLECGILRKHLPDVEMISFGPNIRAAHSPDEKVQISSVQKYWKFLLEILKEIPKK